MSETWYCNGQGILITAVLCASSICYGMHLIVALATLYWNHRERRHLRTSRVYERNLVSTLFLVFFGSINYVSSIVIYTVEGRARVILGTVFLVATILLTLFTGGFLLVRCYSIWDRNSTVLAAPVVLLIGIAVVGFYHTKAFLNELSLPQLPSGPIISLSLYWLLALILNIMITNLIIFKLIRARRNVNAIRRRSRVQGDVQHLQDIKTNYTGLIALLVESSALYTISVFVGVVLAFEVKNIVVAPIVVQTNCISTELIILRIALRKSWTSPSARSYIPMTEDGRTHSSGPSTTNVGLMVHPGSDARDSLLSVRDKFRGLGSPRSPGIFDLAEERLKEATSSTSHASYINCK